jgi:hypothetical protein
MKGSAIEKIRGWYRSVAESRIKDTSGELAATGRRTSRSPVQIQFSALENAAAALDSMRTK